MDRINPVTLLTGIVLVALGIGTWFAYPGVPEEAQRHIRHGLYAVTYAFIGEAAIMGGLLAIGWLRSLLHGQIGSEIAGLIGAAVLCLMFGVMFWAIHMADKRLARPGEKEAFERFRYW